MTRKIMSLHHEGYTDDFLFLRPGYLWWLQGEREFSVWETELSSIVDIKDEGKKGFRFLLAIQAESGLKGILFIEEEKVRELGQYVTRRS
jgi:hypothetical protein